MRSKLAKETYKLWAPRVGKNTPLALEWVSMKTCAYCGKGCKPSKEHLFPKWVLKRQPESDARFALHENRISERVATIRDVCRPCNNGPLSELDTYVLGLYDRYFGHPVSGKSSVNFACDYELLARWLLKTLYNSARINNTRPDELQPFKEYVLGGGSTPKEFRIFGFLILPYKLSLKEQQRLSPENDGITHLFPRNIGVTQFAGRISGTDYLLLGRAVLLNSYCMVVSILPPGLPRSTRRTMMDDITDTLRKMFAGLRVIDPRFKSVRLYPSTENIVSLKRDSLSLFADAYKDYFRRRRK